MEQVPLLGVGATSSGAMAGVAIGGDSLEIIYSTPERDQINNVRSAKRLARGGDASSKRQIVDGLGAIHGICSNIQTSCQRAQTIQDEQGVYLHSLHEQMQSQINGLLEQQNLMQEQLSRIESNQEQILGVLEGLQAEMLERSLRDKKTDRDSIDLKSIVPELRSASNKLTAVAIQHTTGISEVRSIANSLNTLVTTHWPKGSNTMGGYVPSTSRQGNTCKK